MASHPTIREKMFNFLSKNKIKCERCGTMDNLLFEKVFGVYATRLCNKCWREWTQFIMGNKDYLGMLTISQKSINANGTEKENLNLLTYEILRELYPVLEKWLYHSS